MKRLLLLVTFILLFIVAVTAPKEENKVSASSLLFPTCSTQFDCKAEFNGKRYYFPCINNQCAAISCNSGNVSECATHGDSTSNQCIVGTMTVNGHPAIMGNTCANGPYNLPSTVQVPTATPTPTVTPGVNVVVLPSIFTGQDSLTTDLSAITAAEAPAYVGLTFDKPGVAGLKFTGAVDLTNEALITALGNLNNFMTLDLGIIYVDTDAVPQLAGIPATLTMEGLAGLDPNNIVILRNGVVADATYVSNVQYDEVTGTLTFDVTGFSEYKVDIEASTPEVFVPTSAPQNAIDTRVIAIGGLLLLFVVIATVFVYKKMGAKKATKKDPEPQMTNDTPVSPELTSTVS